MGRETSLLVNGRSAPRSDTPRILHIKGSGGFGGDCVLILELGRMAREQGYGVDVLAVDPVMQDLVRREGLGVVDLDVIRREIRPLWDLRGLARLTSFLAGSRYSIVHTHTSKPGVVGTLAARRARIPAVIHTFHLLPFHEESTKLTTMAYVAIERMAARWCDRIVTVSEHQRAWALRYGIGDARQVVAIPNGVPAARAQPSRTSTEVRAELGVGDDFMVLSTGRLATQKGLEHLVSAAAIVRRRVPGAKIVLAGDGPLRDALTQLVDDLGLHGTVQVLGFRPDVGDLLAASDLVVLPSLWEGLSISLLEAMAAGKPVVTTSIGGNREATNDGETAVLVPPKDPYRLAEAIIALANDPGRRAELGHRGFEVQRARYGIQRMLDAYAAEYERLLQRATTSATLRTRHLAGAS
jgi:glycosyltransferase involved in cell wall biosynthesis